MHEPLLDRIRELERANRRWKTACAILATGLLAVLTSGAAWVGLYGYQTVARNQEAMRAADQARMQEMRAREAAQAARRQAAEALQQAQEKAAPK